MVTVHLNYIFGLIKKASKKLIAKNRFSLNLQQNLGHSKINDSALFVLLL